MVLLVFVAAAVSVGVVLSNNGNGEDKVTTMPVENRTVAADETNKPSSSPPNNQEPTSTPTNPPPTRHPARLSTSPVTEQPTDDPTLDPTLPPTVATLAPTSTRPTPLPTTTAPIAGAVAEQFMNGLPRYSLELASTNASSPQAKALDWLQKDPQYNEYQNVYRLNQRYALAVLYYSVNGELRDNSSGWLSNVNECAWYQYDDEGPVNDSSCVEGSRLRVLNLDRHNSGWIGTIPTELELLTDLEYMYLDGELSGAIHSEL
jgi:hypothetical protein